MQHILITGGNTGIGKATAIALAKKGHTIIIACRNESKAKEAIIDIKETSKNEAIHFIACDLASFDSIKNCAFKYRQQFGKLDILINNAGLITDELQLTKDGFELQIGVNHLGHFLLTNQVIDMLEKSTTPRIINVSSKAHLTGKINFNSFKGEIDRNKYNGMAAYRQSKLANVLFTIELAKRYPQIVSHSLHPGVVNTEIAGNKSKLRFGLKLMWKILTPFKINTAKGARTSVYLATSHDVLGINGKYFDKQKEATASPLANDALLAKKLWEVSEELIA